MNDVKREANRFHDRMTSVRVEWIEETKEELKRLRQENAELKEENAKLRRSLGQG